MPNLLDGPRVRRLLTAALLTYPVSALHLPTQVVHDLNTQMSWVPELKTFYSGAGALLAAAGAPDLAGLLPQGLAPGFDAVLQRRDMVLVGAAAHEIVVAFRGTLPPDFDVRGMAAADWLNDGQATYTTVPKVPGKLHAGFGGAVAGLWAPLAKQLEALIAAHPGLPVCFTGHSKGGPMAQIAAVKFKAEFKTAPLVCTFAAARPGDATFARAFAAAVADDRRYEYGADVVPHLPPTSGEIAGMVGMFPQEIANVLPYCSAGRLYYLPLLAARAGAPGQAPELTPPPPGAAPITDLAAAAHLVNDAVRACLRQDVWNVFGPAQRGPPWVATNHSIGPGSGYDLWLRGA